MIVDGGSLPIEADDVRVLKTAALRHAEEFPLIVFPTKSGQPYLLHDDAYRELCASFPGINVAYEIRVAFAWIAANEKRRKTERGMRRFLTGWLTRAGERQ